MFTKENLNLLKSNRNSTHGAENIGRVAVRMLTMPCGRGEGANVANFFE